MKQVENTAKKWTNKAVAIVVVIIILGAADSLLLCLSILRERKKERKRERDQRDLIASLLRFSPKRQESPDERDKNRTKRSLF